MPALRIFVADRDEVVRQVISSIVTAHPGWQICGEASEGNEAVTKVRELKPDVVLLEVAIPGLYGLQAALQMVQNDPDQKIIVLGVRDSDTAARDAFAAGALGYVLTANAARDLSPAIVALQDGRTFFTPRIAEHILHEYMGGNRGAGDAGLQAQERRALKFLAREAATTVLYRPEKPKTLPKIVKYAAIVIAVVVTGALAWSNFHETLEEKFPFIDKLLVKTGVKAAPENTYEGNPDTKVWIDLKTGLYYCPGSKLYGKTAEGKMVRQRDAQMQQYEAEQKACD